MAPAPDHVPATNPPSPTIATGEADRVALGVRSSADRHKDDARRNRFEEDLNDTTGRPKRVFRKTPPPPIKRTQSTSDAAAPSQDCEGG